MGVDGFCAMVCPVAVERCRLPTTAPVCGASPIEWHVQWQRRHGVKMPEVARRETQLVGMYTEVLSEILKERTYTHKFRQKMADRLNIAMFIERNSEARVTVIVFSFMIRRFWHIERMHLLFPYSAWNTTLAFCTHKVWLYAGYDRHAQSTRESVIIQNMHTFHFVKRQHQHQPPSHSSSFYRVRCVRVSI